MKNLILFTGCVVFCSLKLGYCRKSSNSTSWTFTPDEDQFWIRYLQYEHDFSNAAPSSTPGKVCNVELNIKCHSLVGKHCSILQPPQASCNFHGNLTSLTFSRQDSNCNTSSHSQDVEVLCVDVLPINPVLAFAMRCDSKNSRSINIDPAIVYPGDIITVTSQNQEDLPPALDCEIIQSNIDGDGKVVQRLTINTSNALPLQLHDKFGALRVEGCNQKSCLSTVCYEGEVTNTGSSKIMLQQLRISFNGKIENSLNEVELSDLDSNSSTIFTSCHTINTCIDKENSAKFEIEAKSHLGATCYDDDEFTLQVAPVIYKTNVPTGRQDVPTSEPSTADTLVFPTLTPSIPQFVSPNQLSSTYPTIDVVECNIDVTLDCLFEDESDCDNVRLPQTTCSNGFPIDVISFKITGYGCNSNGNNQRTSTTCEGDEFVSGPISLECFSADGTTTLVVEPSIVQIGEVVSVRSPSGKSLPSGIDCTIIFTKAGYDLQLLTIDTSGDETLSLNDDFGGLKVVSCGDKSCFQKYCYTVAIDNIGENDANITHVELKVNNVNDTIIPTLDETILKPDESERIEVCVNSNVCDDVTFLGTVSVEANAIRGKSCRASDDY